MKIALCLFGSTGSIFKQKRNLSKNFLDPEICFKSIKKNIIDKFETDVFFHVWKSNYDKKLIKIYNPKSFKIENPINFNPDLSKYSLKFINCYDDILNLKEDNKNPEQTYTDLAYRAHSRWHSQTKVLEILENYKKNKKIKYDFIIQTRFDLIVNNLPNLKNLNNRKMYLVKKGKESTNSLYDIFFISDFKIAQKIKKIKKKIYNYPIDPPQALYFFFKDENISYQNYIEFKDVILYRYLIRKKNLLKKLVFLFVFCPLNFIFLSCKKILKIVNKFLNYE